MTPQQFRALEFIKSYWEDNGYAPSYDNIKDGLGAKSKSSISALLERLEQRGYITRTPRNARSIRVTKIGNAATKDGAGASEEEGTSADPPWGSPSPP